jgi:Zn-dependent protease/CBS domain-containing protein
MSASIRLGKVFGIEVGFNWSLLFIFAFISWTLAGAVLPGDVPKQPQLAYWAAGIGGALIFYAALLAHELSHAVVARRQGMRVAGITLWLFGGVSRLEGEPASARDEALFTVVGPLTSWAAAAVLFALDLVTGALGGPRLLSDLLAWLAYINLALGAFNLVPAFPLDGGRLLEACFWWRSGSRRLGVHQAVLVGRVFAFLMIAGGVLEIFAGAALDGLWIAFIGWFLLSAAGAEESGVVTRALLRGVPVSAAMSSPVVTVPAWLTVEEFLTSRAGAYHFTTYPLHDLEGRLIGIVRLADLLKVPAPQRPTERLQACARPLSEIVQTTAGEDLGALVERAGPVGLESRILVFDAGRVVGIISPTDIARLLTVRGAQGEQGLAA